MNSLKTPMHDLANGIAGRFSCSLVPNWRMENLAMTRRLQALFSRHAIDTVIDVGANAGQFRDFLRHEVGFAGKIESFEPIPELHAKLAAKATQDPLWSVHPFALGAAPGSFDLNVMASADFSSFLSPLAAGSILQQEKNKVARTVQVKVSTLDNEFGDSLRNRNVYLKLDTQGFDLEVVRGGKKILSAVPCLQTEVSFIPLYDQMPSYAQAIEELKGFGYAVADMFVVSHDDAGRALEFDCVMVRPPDSAN